MVAHSSLLLHHSQNSSHCHFSSSHRLLSPPTTSQALPASLNARLKKVCTRDLLCSTRDYTQYFTIITREKNLKSYIYIHICSSVAQSCPTLCDPMNRSTTGLPVHHQLPEFTQTHVHQVRDAIQHLILGCPLLLLPPIPPSIRVFSNESTLRMRWPNYWSFSFSIIPSKEHPGLISFRMDWLDLLAVQGTLKSLLQHHSSKASVLRCSAFFTVQLSHPYMTTGKTIALT